MKSRAIPLHIFSFLVFFAGSILFVHGAGVSAPPLVHSEQEFNDVLTKLRPGDTLKIANGTYSPWSVILNVSGTEQKPIVIRAETLNKVVFTGDVKKPLFRLRGSYVTLEGISFTQCIISKENGHTGVLAEIENGSHCRLSACRFTANRAMAQFMPIVVISGAGSHNRIDHCTFSFNTDNQEVQVKVTKESYPLYSLIDHNFFTGKAKVSWPGTNGGECIQVGQDPVMLGTAEPKTTVRENQFSMCNGEPEVISNKCSGNKYIQNIFTDCGGELVMRGGHDCVVDSNIIDGGKSGIRINGSGHYITNNQIRNVVTGIRLMYGMTTGKIEPGFYIAATDCVIRNNRIENADTGVLSGDAKNEDWTGKFDVKKYPSRVLRDVAPSRNRIEANTFIHTRVEQVTK